MSIENSIIVLMNNNEKLFNLVGDRIYPLYIPQGEHKDCITYQMINESDGFTTDGPLGISEDRFQFTCFSSSHQKVIEISNALISTLRNYSGIAEGITIQKIQIMGSGDIPSINSEAEQLNRYGRYVEILISYNSE